MSLRPKSGRWVDDFGALIVGQIGKFFTLVRSKNHGRPYLTSWWKSRPFHELGPICLCLFRHA